MQRGHTDVMRCLCIERVKGQIKASHRFVFCYHTTAVIRKPVWANQSEDEEREIHMYTLTFSSKKENQSQRATAEPHSESVHQRETGLLNKCTDKDQRQLCVSNVSSFQQYEVSEGKRTLFLSVRFHQNKKSSPWFK